MLRIQVEEINVVSELDFGGEGGQADFESFPALDFDLGGAEYAITCAMQASWLDTLSPQYTRWVPLALSESKKSIAINAPVALRLTEQRNTFWIRGEVESCTEGKYTVRVKGRKMIRHYNIGRNQIIDLSMAMWRNE